MYGCTAGTAHTESGRERGIVGPVQRRDRSTPGEDEEGVLPRTEAGTGRAACLSNLQLGDKKRAGTFLIGGERVLVAPPDEPLANQEKSRSSAGR